MTFFVAIGIMAAAAALRAWEDRRRRRFADERRARWEAFQGRSR